MGYSQHRLSIMLCSPGRTSYRWFCLRRERFREETRRNCEDYADCVKGIQLHFFIFLFKPFSMLKDLLNLDAYFITTCRVKNYISKYFFVNIFICIKKKTVQRTPQINQPTQNANQTLSSATTTTYVIVRHLQFVQIHAGRHSKS